jgi:predicted RNase H-like HicB family nuclease
MKIKIIIEKTKTGYSAYAENYPVYSVGNSLDELKLYILEALNLYFENKNKSVTENDLKMTLNLSQFFEYYSVINIHALSKHIGINQDKLAQYISGTKKPTPTQTYRILKGVQQIGKELSSIQFIL